jgi:hypothetical protein
VLRLLTERLRIEDLLLAGESATRKSKRLKARKPWATAFEPEIGPASLIGLVMSVSAIDDLAVSQRRNWHPVKYVMAARLD